MKINCKKLRMLTNQCINWSLELKEKGFLTLVNELIRNYKNLCRTYDADLYRNLLNYQKLLKLINQIILFEFSI